MIIMIKCPFCGSAAQPKIKNQVAYDNNNSIKIEYECGCGCMFEVVAAIQNARLLDFDEEEDY